MNRAERRLTAKNLFKSKKSFARGLINMIKVCEYCYKVKAEGPEKITAVLPLLKMSEAEFYLFASLGEKGKDAIVEYHTKQFHERVAIANRILGI